MSPMGGASKSIRIRRWRVEQSSGWWCGPGEEAMLTRELIGRLPKAELHTHLDSALPPAPMVERARPPKFGPPPPGPPALRGFRRVDDAGSLGDSLARF